MDEILTQRFRLDRKVTSGWLGVQSLPTLDTAWDIRHFERDRSAKFRVIDTSDNSTVWSEV